MSSENDADASGEVDAGVESAGEPEAGIDVARLGRTLVLIGVVTAVFTLLTANRLDGATAQVGFVAIGTVAFITAVVGFFIAAGEAMDD